MGIGKTLTSKKKAGVKTVLGIDASTNSLAFCLYDKNGPVKWGEIKFKGASVFERLSYAQKVIKSIRRYLKADLIVFEGAVYVQNKKTVILLAYSFGAVVSTLLYKGTRIEEIAPLTWQNAIGNKPLTKAEKDKIMKANPGKSKSWYQNANREFRKQRTIQWCEDTFGIKVHSDNVGDAIGISHVGFEKYA